MRRVLLAAMVLGFWASLALAQQAVGPLTLQSTGAVGNGIAVSTPGLTLATVQVVAAGGFDRTITFEVTEDGTNYVSVFCRNIATGAQATTATVSGVYMCSIGGNSRFRARTSGGAASGTLTVTVTLNQGIVDAGVVASSAAPSTTSAAVSPVEGSTLFNTSTTGAAAAVVTTSIAAVAATRVHLYSASAYCGAGGSATLTVKDGVAGTTIWVSPAGFIGVVLTSVTWPTGLTTTTANGMDVVLGSCGGGITGTLQVQADRF